MLTQGDAPQDGYTPLFIAAFKDNVAAAQMLLQAGADMDAQTPVRARG